MLSVNLKIIGDKETVQKLNNFKFQLMDWSSELRSVGNFLQNFYQNSVFETEGGIFQAPWAPLSPLYDLWKRTNYPGRGTLERTGKMRKSWDLDVSPSYVKLTNTSDYAKFHQFGTSKMPKRTMVGLDEQRKNEIIKIFKKGLVSKLKRTLS